MRCTSRKSLLYQLFLLCQFFLTVRLGSFRFLNDNIHEMTITLRNSSKRNGIFCWTLISKTVLVGAGIEFEPTPCKQSGAHLIE